MKRKNQRCLNLHLFILFLFRAYVYRITEVIDSIENKRKTE